MSPRALDLDADTSTVPVLEKPQQEHIPLFCDAQGFERAATLLRRGHGPLAVDTERASGFRYDDRAFLIQLHRQDSGIILIDPEGHREEFRRILSPVLSTIPWIIHAAHTDLPCLAWLGCYPPELIDTELGGRLAGIDRVNLSHMCALLLGHSLAKGHGAEDWSQRPLPEEWLRYAALDVALLLDLADAVTVLLESQGRWECARQEFEYVRRTHAGITAPEPSSWRDLKGVDSLKSPRQLAVAKALWTAREKEARRRDIAHGRVLSSKALLEIARNCPHTLEEMRHVKGVRRRAAVWLDVTNRALSKPSRSYPRPAQRDHEGAPSVKTWKRFFPESYAPFAKLKSEMGRQAASQGFPADNVLSPALLRDLGWEIYHNKQISTPFGACAFLREHGARPWQVNFAAPVLARVLGSS
ncbi:HRDC domain-containing protein [Corynebacterium uropygiale]|uniref:HRDC domain-containing protein n=1 Tax=Corynebacterium uropygiale TaxID=1775911 RepID=A0A9X1QP14_9CORY|nr:HRDC domain-containing protein [Corynebacterium uropygiale]MCF4006506.1 HRDC domain-containing protein [Corynebacterium uropygiale]